MGVCRKLKNGIRYVQRKMVATVRKYDLNETPETEEEIKRFIDCAPITWYQRIDLPFGLKTPGRDSNRKFETAGLNKAVGGKVVLDIGCNAGAFCFNAEKYGALEVHGIDVDLNMIRTAEVVARIKKSRIFFHNIGIKDAIREFGEKRFDISFAFAVLHKIVNSEDQWRILSDPDYDNERTTFQNALKAIIRLTKETVFVELTYRFKGYPASGERYPDYEEIEPLFFKRTYQIQEYFSSIKMIGEIGGFPGGGKRRIIYKCEVSDEA